MIYLFLHMVGAFGFAYVLGYSRITLRARELIFDKAGAFGQWFVRLIECPACLGFWLGVFVGSRVHPVEMRRWLFMICFAFFTAGSNYALGKWTGLIREGKPDAVT
jgi:hypothetical protein